MSLNIVHLVGRAGVDPEVKYFESGTVLCKFPIAVDRRSKKDDKPDWFELEMWGRTAEVASEYVRKGKQVGIQGKLKIDTWQDQNGNNRSRPVIRVDRLELLGSKGEAQGGTGGDYAPDEF
ncbi:single-stranded DNA-binding protein [Euhalothece natronophila Z-M001]|uniref:Single-stranded DNA-binding protein n=1 Tax=Euhalothece natronophila Z-M001 TaxID=522448 RepID=A0A5B8NSW2_9CHRO|nr:single-stranded DNA-binding protein [Euhalothece natronophila]QDZ41405.1 single-stranded DNA-binding protein [Euhalothece natronophila Z-M001]